MKTILLLEDLPEIRAWLRLLLLQVFPSAQISEAARVSDAMSLIQAIQFDLAMVDLGLPDGSGRDVVEKLRELQPDAQSVVVTIHDDDDHLFPALQCGASGYLLKEDRFEVLVEELQRIVRGQPPLSPSMARRMQAFLRAQNLPEGDARALAPRESEVLLQISKGFTVKEIARLMGMKGQMVNEHIRGAYRKLALASAPQQALLAGATLDT